MSARIAGSKVRIVPSMKTLSGITSPRAAGLERLHVGHGDVLSEADETAEEDADVLRLEPLLVDTPADERGDCRGRFSCGRLGEQKRDSNPAFGPIRGSSPQFAEDSCAWRSYR